MEKKSLIMLRVLINRYHRGMGKDLVNQFPESLGQQLLEEEVSTDEVEPALGRPELLLERIHYSWIADSLIELEEELQPYAVASLSKSQQAGVCRLTGILSSEPPPTEPVKKYFLSLLCRKMGIYEMIPPQYVVKSKLQQLLHLTKKKIINLVDLLGIYDLAMEVRKIINKQRLRHLLQSLSDMQRDYLKVVLYLQEKFPQEKLGMEQFKKKLNRLPDQLHKHGLIRLAKALSGEKADFMWHIRRIMDTGRSAILDKHWSEREISLVTPASIQQVLHALSFMQNWESRT